MCPSVFKSTLVYQEKGHSSFICCFISHSVEALHNERDKADNMWPVCLFWYHSYSVNSAFSNEAWLAPNNYEVFYSICSLRFLLNIRPLISDLFLWVFNYFLQCILNFTKILSLCGGGDLRGSFEGGMLVFGMKCSFIDDPSYRIPVGRVNQREENKTSQTKVKHRTNVLDPCQRFQKPFWRKTRSSPFLF